MYPQHLAGVWPAIESTDAAPPQRPILTAAQWADRTGCANTPPGGDNAVGESTPFLTGLRNPQHLLAWRDGSLLVSDFATGTIFRITKE